MFVDRNDLLERERLIMKDKEEVTEGGKSLARKQTGSTAKEGDSHGSRALVWA